MKKIINLLCFLLIINFIILCNLISKYYTNEDLIPISYAKSFEHSNDNYNLISKILKDTNKDNLLKYIDYINISITDNIPNDINNKIAFTLSLPDQNSFIAIYKKVNKDNLKFEFLLDNLSTINKFYFYKDFFIIEQKTSDSSTNFTNREFFEVFSKNNDNVYSSVLKKDIYSEKIITHNNIITKEVNNSSIDYLNTDIPTIICINTFTKYKSTDSDINSPFEETEKITIKEFYEWNNEKKEFINSKIENVN